MSSPGARARDPHFRKILEGLAGRLDTQLFEECVQDLLREDFPGLAGVHGGSDAGMDGAIPDGEGTPFALIATTQADVIGNLTQSLRARLAAGDTRRKAVLATSEALSPRRRSNLERRAEELGFLLVQTFDRRDIASRLDRDSRWTKMLLGITGEPPALSAFPRRRRDLPEVELVSRDEDLAWLRATLGDRLIVGEPGAGKTSLLLELVEEGRALFLATEDEGRFAEAFSDHRPEIVLVDDAHLEPARLDRLRQIRHDMQAEGEFAIVATSWKGDAVAVADALGGLPEEQVLQLDLLTPAEILEVLRRIGIQAPDDDSFLAELVSQAAGRPGLAVTLGTLALSGSYRDVLSGQAVYRSLIPGLQRIMERDPTQLLAAFALGGQRGMGLAAVAEFLGSGVGEVWETAARIGASGVLSERGKDEAGEAVLAVNPATLRLALLHEVFFSPAGRAWEPLLRQAQSFASALEILVLAATRKVPVPRGELQRLILDVDSPEAWEGFAALGEAEAVWVLEHYPGPTADIAAQILESAPGRAISRLLKDAEAAVDPTGANATKPLEPLRTWIEAILTGPDWLSESLGRRRHLVDAALGRLEEGGDPTVALRAAFLALSPRLESTRMAATGGAVVFRHGSLLASAVPQMLELWERVRGAIRDMERDTWRELDNALHWWLYPNVGREDMSEGQLESFHRVARRILRDLVPFAEGRPGLTSALLERAQELGLDLDLTVDPVFSVLYPPGFSRIAREDEPEDWGQILRVAGEEARQLARTWAQRRPEDVVTDLARYEAETRWNDGSLGTIAEFERTLAEAVEAPSEWLSTLLEKAANTTLVRGFLFRVVEEQRPGWRSILEGCLRTGQYARAAAERVLWLGEPPEDLLELALTMAEPQLVETACLQGKVSSATLRRLLAHADWRIAVASAIGEWLAEPRHEVRPEIEEEWQGAILRASARNLERHDHERYWLKEIFSHEPKLAFQWLRRQLAVGPEERRALVTQHGVVAAAIRSLDASARARLLIELPPRSFSSDLVSHLVGDSPEFFKQLLSRSDLRKQHLAPLAGNPPDDRWIQLARLALEAGHTPKQLTETSFRSPGFFGSSVEHYTRWETAFRDLSALDDPAFREVARLGLRQAEKLVQEARAAERRLKLAGHR